MTDRRVADLVQAPSVVGMTVKTARQVASLAGVVLAAPDADGPPLAALTWPGVWAIVSQSPLPGSSLHRWDSVVVRCAKADDNGGAGVREPRRPLPNPPSTAAAIEFDTGQP
jgi:hypothetical protein